MCEVLCLLRDVVADLEEKILREVTCSKLFLLHYGKPLTYDKANFLAILEFMRFFICLETNF